MKDGLIKYISVEIVDYFNEMIKYDVFRYLVANLDECISNWMRI